jgi:hypothetical protein
MRQNSRRSRRADNDQSLTVGIVQNRRIDMRRAHRRFVVALVSALATAAARPVASEHFMFPALIILRGGGLHAPVVLNHAGQVGGDVSSDTVAILYGSLSRYEPKSADRVRRRPFVEVAEFFGPSYMVYASGHSKPPAFERASHFSRIYFPAGGEPPLWDSPVVAPGGAATAFYALGQDARHVLELRGLRLR